MPAEKVFDEAGNEIDPSLENEVQPIEGETPDPDAEGDETPAATGKYKIGDQTFDTYEAAHAYATSQVGESSGAAQGTDAYRQAIQDVLKLANPQNGVTPAPEAPAFDEAEYYEKPAEFLNKFAKKITDETVQAIDSRNAEANRAAQIWNDFSNRHPDLAEFKADIEMIAGQNLTDLQAVNRTKGFNAGYDFLALKMRAKIEAFKQAGKPRRELQNGKGGAGPSGAGTGSVTPKNTPKKVLSFVEQVKQHRAKRFSV